MTKKGIVIKSTGSWFLVKTSENEYFECKIKGKFRIKGIRSTNPVAVGDQVEFTVVEQQIGLIHHIEERKNYVIRKATNLSKASHIIAANVDQAFLIISLTNPKTSRGFIDRFLVVSEAYHIPIGLIFNKIDLYDDDLWETHHHLTELYTKIGYTCVSVSAISGENIDKLKKQLEHKTTLFSGHSGVGKSALINALHPESQRKVGNISGIHLKGKHTTTYAEMIEMPFDSQIIDTPGIKEFGLYDFEKNEIAERFPEMRALMLDCKFNNCTHIHEPGCAIKQAVEEHKIDDIRYKNYLNMYNGEEFDIINYE